MGRFLLLFALPLWAAAATFSMMDYNVENLFDLEYGGNEYHEYIPNTAAQWNQKNYAIKLAHTAQVIIDGKADIITLEEVESDKALRDLQNTLAGQHANYLYRAITTQKVTVVHTALLSKYPITKTDEITVDDDDKIRSILVATLSIQGKELTLFVNHWKSKSGPESKRLSYAKALKRYLKAHPAITEYVITGDLNSNYDEYKTFKKSRRFNDTKGITGVNHILKTLDKKELVTAQKIKTTDYLLHYDLWLELPEKERWSHNFYGKHGSLDHMIIPKALFDAKGIDYLPNSFLVFKPEYLINQRHIIQRWQLSRKKPIHHTGRGYSDHLPIIATFVLY